MSRIRYINDEPYVASEKRSLRALITTSTGRTVTTDGRVVYTRVDDSEFSFINGVMIEIEDNTYKLDLRTAAA